MVFGSLMSTYVELYSNKNPRHGETVDAYLPRSDLISQHRYNWGHKYLEPQISSL